MPLGTVEPKGRTDVSTKSRLHRDLRSIPLSDVLPLGSRPGQLVITMSTEQWDSTLSAAYAGGFILLELDENEKPVRAYKKATE